MDKYIKESDLFKRILNVDFKHDYDGCIKFCQSIPAADVVELNAFRDEVYQYIGTNNNEDANFLSGLETALVIAEKMAGVYEEVDE